MKNLVVIFIFFLLAVAETWAQPLDSATAKKMLGQGVGQIVKAIDQSTATTAKLDSTIRKLNPAPSIPLDNHMANLLTLLPVIFYFTTLLLVTGKLKREGVKLGWFLLDKELIAQLGKQAAQVETARFNAIAKAPTPEAADALAALPAIAFNQQPPAEDGTTPPTEAGKESVSRLIALLTGLITLGLASCLTSFYIYKSFTGHPDVDLGKLATVLYGLGLGLVPYGFTKVAGVLKG